MLGAINNMRNNLSDCNILIARPQKLAQELINQIAAEGGTSLCQPLFSVRSLLDECMIARLQQELVVTDIVVFISRNGAEITLPYISSSQHVVWSCVGPATANFLKASGLKDVIYPHKAPYDSRGLLDQLAADGINLHKKRVLILTGLDGEAWLAQALHKQGALVNTLAVYKRVMPDLDLGSFIKLFNNTKRIDIILITCVTSLVNLQNLAREAKIEVNHLPLLVVSERIRKHALENGHKNVYTSASMSDSDIMCALRLACKKLKGE